MTERLDKETDADGCTTPSRPRTAPASRSGGAEATQTHTTHTSSHADASVTSSASGCLGQSALRNWIEFRRNHLAFLQRVARTCGDFASFRIGPQTLILICDPRLIREVLVVRHDDFIRGPGHQAMKRIVLGNGLLTSDGAFHHRQRRLAQPAFHKKRITSYASVMADYAERAASSWTEGLEMDLNQEMMRLSLSVLTKSLIDADIDYDAQDIGEDVTTVLEGSFRLLDSPIAYLATRFSLWMPRSPRLRRAQARLDRVIYEIIAERRRSGVDHGDFISMLLMAQDQDTSGQGMTDLQVRDEAMTILVAGQETIALAMTWTWYLLAQHPDIESRLHREVDEVLGGRLPTATDLPALDYTRRTLMEAMRLYPPVWAVGRIACRDVELAGGKFVPKDALVMLSPYIVQHDPRYFPNPERFDPDRWLNNENNDRQKLSYFPFLTGPNRCIGEHYAWQEGILAIATIARHWSFSLSPGQVIEAAPLITLRPRYGLRVVPKRRPTRDGSAATA